jgi:hypothetical protein
MWRAGAAGVAAFDGDRTRAAVGWVADNGRPDATSLDDERRDVVPEATGRAAVLPTIGRLFVFVRGVG